MHHSRTATPKVSLFLFVQIMFADTALMLECYGVQNYGINTENVSVFIDE